MKTKILLKKWKILVSNINYISERHWLPSVFFVFFNNLSAKTLMTLQVHSCKTTERKKKATAKY